MRYRQTVAQQIVVIGPSASGKSAIGAAVAARLEIPFLDADDLHPPENVAQMRSEQPLTDRQRMPWLAAVGKRIAMHPVVVMACSALTAEYRSHILSHAPEAVFVELRCDRSELARRMAQRQHFMPPALLESQLSTWQPLTEDEPGFAVANDGSIALTTDRIVTMLAKR